MSTGNTSTIFRSRLLLEVLVFVTTYVLLRGIVVDVGWQVAGAIAICFLATIWLTRRRTQEQAWASAGAAAQASLLPQQEQIEHLRASLLPQQEQIEQLQAELASERLVSASFTDSISPSQFGVER